MHPLGINNAANAAKSLNTADPGSEQSGKSGPSKFDKVREAMSEEPSSQTETAKTSQTSAAEAPQKVRPAQEMDKVSRSQAPGALGDDLNRTKASLDHVKNRVAALPDQGAVQPLRKQLSDLETQFSKAGEALKGMKGTASPQQLLKLQSDMFQINERLGIMSKMVDQITGGVKSVLQTQI